MYDTKIKIMAMSPFVRFMPSALWQKMSDVENALR